MLFDSIFILLSVGIFVLIFLSSNCINIVKGISLLISGTVLMLSSLIFLLGNNYPNFTESKVFGISKIFNLEMDLSLNDFSIYFFLLSALLSFLCLIFIWEDKNFKLFAVLLLFLEFLLLLTFSISNVLLFYIFFEAILMPMYLIIGIWGSREKKIRAAYLFFFYTVFGSLLMLISILYIYTLTGTFNLEQLYLKSKIFNLETQIFLWIAFFFSFASKIPMFPVHIWLPEAHVEAPTIGSVLLAGVLLKLGVYGFLRYLFPLFPDASIFFSPLVYTLCLLGLLSSSLTAIVQTDLKKIIAYSSIAHMNLVVLGIFCGNILGIEASIVQSISHGYVSGALFFMIGILYKQYHSRLLYYYGGLVFFMPLYSIFFLFFIMSNIALPGTSSFIGEFLLLLGLFYENIVCAFIAGLSVVLSGAYSLWLYNRIIFGNIKSEILGTYRDLSLNDFFILSILFLLSLQLGLCPTIFLDGFYYSVVQLFFITNAN